MEKISYDDFFSLLQNDYISEHPGVMFKSIFLYLKYFSYEFPKKKFFALKNDEFLLPCWSYNKNIELFLGGDIWQSGFLLKRHTLNKNISIEDNFLCNLEKFLSYLFKDIGNIDIFIFPYTRLCFDKIKNLVLPLGLKALKRELALARYIDLNQSYDDYINSKYMRKYVKKIKAKQKKIYADFSDVKHKIYKQKDEIKRAFEYVVDISNRSWKAEINTQIGASKKVNYYRELWEYFSEINIGEIHLLFIDNKPVSFVLIVYDESNRVVYLLKNGYDKRYKFYYVGAIVQLFALKKIFSYNEKLFVKYKNIDFISDFTNSRLFCKEFYVVNTVYLYNKNSFMANVCFFIDKYIKPQIKKYIMFKK